MSPDPALRHASHRLRVLLVALSTLALQAAVVTTAPRASAAVGVPTSFLDQAYSASSPPSADKPQSKLWFADGSWWALMVASGGTATYVHQLMPDHTWRNTGALVDSRANSTGDALWSPSTNKLWVVSRVDAGDMIVDRFTYNSGAKTWSVDAGFPKSIPSGGSESATIDQDSQGRFWVTWTRQSTVWVAHSTDASGASWTPPFKPNVGDTTLKADDISALIAFGSSIGVMYSDEQSGGFHFAIHNDADPDSTWRSEDINNMPLFADDHINIKQLVGDPQGRIFAAIKTSANDSPTAQPTDPLTGVLTRTPDAGGTGNWTFAVAGTVGDDQTRPMIMIDATNQQLYYFATAPQNGGDIIYKKTPLSNIAFPPGNGAPFVDVNPVVNNASGAKDPVTGATGLVVLASAQGQMRYAHAEMALAPGGMFDAPADPAPTVTSTSPTAGATNVAVGANVTATFSENVGASVSGTSFTLSSAAGAVPASVTYDATTNTATLDPSADLAANTQYTATLSGIKDSANQGLATNPYTWTFTTASGGGTGTVTVTARTPAPGATAIAVGTNITATFSGAVQNVNSTTFTVRPTAGGSAVAGVFSHSGNKWTFNPSANLAPDTRYTVTLTGGPSGIQGTTGASFTTDTWEFLTGPAPKVSSHVPASGATGVSRTANVTATFNEAVANVSAATFTLTPTGGAPVSATVTRSGTTNRWILDPSGTLTANTQYTVTVTGGANGITDLAGNPLATTTWSFTTGA